MTLGSVRFPDQAAATKANEAWLNQRAAQGKTQRADGTFVGSDDSSVQQANPFSTYNDKDGKPVFEYNAWTDKNGVQGDMKEPGRSFMDDTNRRAMDNFNFQTDKLAALSKQGQDRIEKMFNTSIFSQAFMAQQMMNS